LVQTVNTREGVWSAPSLTAKSRRIEVGKGKNMKIRYTEFALNPSLRNTFAHLPAHRAQALIDSGAAVEVPMPSRGSAGWLAAMAEQEQLRIGSIPADSRDIFHATPIWQVSYLKLNNKYVVERLHGSEKTIYGELPIMDRGRPDFKAAEKQFVELLKEIGCPLGVIQQWQRERNKPDYLLQEQNRIEQEKQAQAMQRERDRNTMHFI
jgi:hypothetical protein